MSSTSSEMRHVANKQSETFQLNNSDAKDESKLGQGDVAVGNVEDLKSALGCLLSRLIGLILTMHLDGRYAPQLSRDLSYLEIIGCAFTVTNLWLGVTGGFSTGVAVGGTSCVVYGLIIIAVFTLCIVTSLGELISAYPNAGGQYFWALKLAPRGYERVSAYITGFCNLVGGLCGASSAAVAASNMILGAVKLTTPDFMIRNWHTVLLAIAFNTLCAIGNFFRTILTRSVVVGMFFCIGSCLLFLVVTPSVAEHHTSPSFLFASSEQNSGWSSNAMAFFVGMINSNYSFAMIDTAIHLAEEVRNPEKVVPRALLFTVVVGFFSAWPVALAILSCMTDYEAIVNTDTGVPLLELLHMAMRHNKGAAIFMQMLLVGAYF